VLAQLDEVSFTVYFGQGPRPRTSCPAVRTQSRLVFHRSERARGPSLLSQVRWASLFHCS
jgi:hypothetical protein